MPTELPSPPPPSTRPARAGWRQTLYFLSGIGVVVVLGLVVMRLRPQPGLPDGWSRLVPPHDVMALLEYRGRIWSGGRDGLVVLDRETGALLEEVLADAPIAYVTGMAVSLHDDSLWVGHRGGVSRYDGTTWVTQGADDGLPPGSVLALLVDRNGALWVGTEQGLAFLHGGAWTRFTSADGLASDGVSYLFEDSQGRIWAGAGYAYEGGVSVYEEGAWKPSDVQEHLPHPYLNAMLEHDDGTLWYGTGFSSYGGVAIHNGSGWRTLTVDDGLAGAKVRYLFRDAGGAIWVGSEYNGIVWMGAGTQEAGWRTFTPKEGLAGLEVKAMLQDSRGNLWIGTEAGLTRISHDAWTRLGNSLAD